MTWIFQLGGELAVKELESSSHIIWHFRHNDKPSTLNVKWTSEEMISCSNQTMQARAETGVWLGKNCVVLHAVKMAFWQVYDIVTNYMCIYLSELWYFGALVQVNNKCSLGNNQVSFIANISSSCDATLADYDFFRAQKLERSFRYFSQWILFQKCSWPTDKQ